MSRFNFIKTDIDGVWIIETKPIIDHRGYFERHFCCNDFQEIGLNKPIVQINHSRTIGAGSIRGIHYQTAPFYEIKIVRCIKGAIYDVAVDLRKNSPTFLKHIAIELSERNFKMLYIPEGCGHGFQTLSDDAEVFYMVTESFNSKADSAINPLDSILSIEWPLALGCISEKDKNGLNISSDFKGI